MSNQNTTPWTEDRTAYAVKLWREGSSAGQIANKLRESFGLKATRNMVIGRLHRLGECNNPQRDKLMQGKQRSAVAKKERVMVVRKPKPLPPQKPLRGPDIPTPFAKPWQQRTLGQCTWPLTVDGVVWSCCGPIEKGSFCADHARLGYDTGVRKLDVDRSAKHLSRFDRTEEAA